MRALSPREARLVAVLILLAAIALAYFLLIAPVRDGFAARQLERETLLLDYQRNERIAGSMRGLRAAAAAQRRTAGLYTIRAASQPDAVEALRERVLGTARAAGVSAAAASEIPGEGQVVAVRSDLQMTVAQAELFLRALENARPPVRIASINLSSERALAAGRPDLLDIRLEVTAPYELAAAQ